MMERIYTRRLGKRATTIVLLLILAYGAGQAEPQGASASAMRTHRVWQAQSDNPAKQESGLEIKQPLAVTGARVSPAKGKMRVGKAQLTAQHHGHPSEFWIQSADTTLEYDDDADGYFHAFTVGFDADLHYGFADVYAVLYLSFEGGPWNHLATTNIFEIAENDPYDAYSVHTVLDYGYPSGHYDVLIELYEASHDVWVASLGPNEAHALSVLPLEDTERDTPDHRDHGSVEVEYGGGSYGPWEVLLFAIGWVARTVRQRVQLLTTHSRRVPSTPRAVVVHRQP